MNGAFDAMSLGESIGDIVPMLPPSPKRLGRHADVQRSALLAGENVNCRRSLHRRLA
jgi:hypothetical protein